MKKALILLFLSIIAIAQTYPRDLLAVGKWSNGTPHAIRVDALENGFDIEVYGEHTWDFDHSIILQDLPKNHMFTFAAEMSATRMASAYMQVKLYREKKEIQRINSHSNSRKARVNSITFSTRDADTVQLLLRGSTQPGFFGNHVTIRRPMLYQGTWKESVAKQPDFEIVPSYTVCSLYLNNLKVDDEAHFKTILDYRKADAEWQSALPLAFLYGEHRAAGSIVKLEEDTAYELRLTIEQNGEKSVKTASFRTLSPNVPVAKTIVWDKTTFKSASIFSDSGTPRGYIRITAAPGFTLTDEQNSILDAVLNLEGCSYVILDGLRVRGGKRHAIAIKGCDHIIVRNCDLARFGRVGTQRPELNGTYFDSRRTINMDGGLDVVSTDCILIEKNYIHDPNGTTNSWFHSHPAGMEAISIGETSQATIRFNDCVGSDLHRWNDAIEGYGNGDVNGSTYRDAEIYGNLLIQGCDDGMELDGGQSNCRFFYNRTEQHLCGVSTAPCLIGPSYIFQNLIADMGDVYGITGASIKNNFSDSGKGQVFFFNNTLVSGSGFSAFGGSAGANHSRYPGLRKGFAANNIMAGAGYVNLAFYKTFHAKSDYNLFGNEPQGATAFVETLRSMFGQEQHAVMQQPLFVAPEKGLYGLNERSAGRGAAYAIPNFLPHSGSDMGALQSGTPFPLPYRPLPFVTDVQRLDIPYNNGKYGTVMATLMPDKAMTAPLPFTVCISEADRYLTVSPNQGVIQPGQPLQLTFSVIPEGLVHARHNRAVAIIRTPDGLSRHVTVHVDSQPDEALRIRDRQGIVYGSVSKDDKDVFALAFTLTQPGDYYLYCFFNEHPNGRMTKILEDETTQRVTTYCTSSATKPKWIFLGRNSYGGDGPNRPQHFEAGKHVIRLKLPDNASFRPLHTALLPSPNLLLSPFIP